MMEDSSSETKFSNLSSLYDSLDEQIITELDELTTQSLDGKTLEDFNDFLRDLGNFPNLTNELTEKIGEERTKQRMSNNKEKYLKRLFKRMRVILNKIAFGTVTETEKIKKTIPSKWKLTDNYKEKLVL